MKPGTYDAVMTFECDDEMCRLIAAIKHTNVRVLLQEVNIAPEKTKCLNYIMFKFGKAVHDFLKQADVDWSQFMAEDEFSVFHRSDINDYVEEVIRKNKKLQ